MPVSPWRAQAVASRERYSRRVSAIVLRVESVEETVGDVDELAEIFDELAVIAGVAIFAPIGAAVRPMRPPSRRQATEQIIAGAEILAEGRHPAALMLAVEIHRLQRIVDAKWRWIWTAIGLGGFALALAASAVIISAAG